MRSPPEPARYEEEQPWPGPGSALAPQGGAPSPAVASPEQVKRSVFAIHIRPVEGALSLPMRKLHIALTKMAGEQYQGLPREDRQGCEDKVREAVARFREGRQSGAEVVPMVWFSASLREIADAAGYAPDEARALWPAIGALKSRKVQFNVLRHGAQAHERELFPYELDVWLELLSHVARNRHGQVQWSYHPLLLAIMVQPRTFAMLNLELVRNARTYTALALYENCRRFVALGKAGPWSFERWQSLLSPTGERPAWENQYEFLRRIKRAIAELEACEGCDIELVPERVKATAQGPCLQMSVRAREQARLPFGEPLPRNQDLLQRLDLVGFSRAEVRVLLDTHGEEYLLTKLAILDKNKQSPRGVDSPKAWLKAAIARDFQDEEVQREMLLRKQRERTQREQQMQKLREAFAAFQEQQLRARFAAADEASRVHWEVRFDEATQERQELLKSLPGKAKDAAFFGWLKEQPHGLFVDPEEQDLAAFALVWRDSHVQEIREKS